MYTFVGDQTLTERQSCWVNICQERVNPSSCVCVRMLMDIYSLSMVINCRPFVGCGHNILLWTCRSRRDELDGEVFEILLAFTDFVSFKEMMVDYKAVGIMWAALQSFVSRVKMYDKFSRDCHLYIMIHSCSSGLVITVSPSHSQLAWFMFF